MSKTVFCFGGSDAAGAELAKNEHPFVYWFADSIGAAYKNYAKEGSSLGLILHTLITHQSEITADDIVLCVIPPDTRWYDENAEQGFYSVQNWQRDDYFKFLNNKTLEWFRYHHALFIYSMQKILDDIGCYYLMTHSYGQIDEYDEYNLSIDFNRFLNKKSLTDLLSGHTIEWRSYPSHLPLELRYNQDGPPAEVFGGIYFAGCKQHPNELGHKYLAALIKEKYDNDCKI